MNEIFIVSSEESEQSFDITERVRDIAKRSGVSTGFCHVMALHSTAAIVVNETADPNIGRDMIAALGRIVPTKADWLHDLRDDNAHSHIKASLLGSSETIPMQDGELVLGTWQGIWLFEFDGPRERKISVRFSSE